jgi:uncharacterized protein (TIGR03067 family)
MHPGVLILAAALAPADALGPADGVTPPEKAELVYGIEGEWEIVSVLEDGKDITQRFQGGLLVITHDKVKVTLANKNNIVELTYRLGRLKPIPEIDMVHPGDMVNPGHVSRGIYDCNGDHLVWADGGWDKPRPKVLSSEPGSGVQQLWTLRRVKK